jgi:5-(carboxyamino)imidazole ribonucleotide synthase
MQSKKFKLGIYGDGQLARLLTLSAKKQGLSILIYTLNSTESPCNGLAPLVEGRAWDDKEAFLSFASSCESVVLENEFVPASFLFEVDGVNFYPSASSYLKVSDKFKQVELAKSLGLAVPRSKLIKSPHDVEEVKLPCMLKSLRGGYDGYGNFTFKSLDQLSQAKKFVEKCGDCLAQEYIDFDCEVAVVIARDGLNTFNFPLVETIQEKNICHFTITPPRIPRVLQEQVIEAAKNLINAIDGKGVYGVEFFIHKDAIIFNEIAPRTHNSGHFTIEFCSYSQFDALTSLTLGLPLSIPLVKVPSAGMLNLLGTQNGKANFTGDERFQRNPLGFLHLYGKENSRIGRKMGHFTLLGENQESILSELKILKTRYSI